MKGIITVLLIFSFSFCFSQNWSPINASEKFNYQIDTTSYISNTLWVDSIKIINADSLFYLNKVVLDCFDCPWIFDSLTDYKIANQNQFLQERILKEEPDIYHFEGEKTFTLRTHSNLNENWIFDATNNIIATVVEVYEEEIISEIDSIKVIHLSSNDTIWLSKNHGIYKFREGEYAYELKGIEGRNIGEIIPDFWDFYNFDIGDVFQYEHSGNVLFTQWETIDKYEILSKEINSTGFIYEVDRVTTTIEDDGSGSYPISSTQGIDTIVFEEPSADYYTELYNKTLVSHINSMYLCGGSADYDVKNYMGIYKDAMDQRVVKKTGNPFPYQQDKFISYHYPFNPNLPDYYPDTLNSIGSCSGASFYYEFKEGIGLICSKLSGFETTESSRLVGYVKGVDTVGTISDNMDIFVLIDNTEQISEEYENQIKIYPNPSVDGNFNISFYTLNDIQINVYKLDGELIYKMPQSFNNLSIDLSNQPTGIYVIKLSNQNFIKSYKLIKI